MSRPEASFYLDHVAQMRTAACMTMGRGFDTDHALHLQMYASEMNEYVTATNNNDLPQIADAMGDIITVAAGYALDAGPYAMIQFDSILTMLEAAADRHNIILHGAFLLVHESNMSKLCTAAEIELTRKKYADRGVYLDFKPVPGDLFSVFARNSTDDTPKGKWLKGISYAEPNWAATEIWFQG
jgi:hypothetical protein